MKSPIITSRFFYLTFFFFIRPTNRKLQESIEMSQTKQSSSHIQSSQGQRSYTSYLAEAERKRAETKRQITSPQASQPSLAANSGAFPIVFQHKIVNKPARSRLMGVSEEMGGGSTIHQIHSFKLSSTPASSVINMEDHDDRD